MHTELNGIDLNFEISGREGAPAVVLHHPLGTALSFWDAFEAALRAHYRVIRFDARGHGKSSAPPAPYDFPTLTADVVALMDHLGLDKVRYVGLSMGGMVGQYLGLLHPDRLHALCLVSTSCETPQAARPIWEERIRTLSTSGYTPELVSTALGRWLAPETTRSRPDIVERFRSYLMNTPIQGYLGWTYAIRDLALADRISAIRAPTLVVVGELDPATPPSFAEMIASRIPGAELKVLPGVSHMLNVETPEAFHATTLPFLERHGPRKA